MYVTYIYGACLSMCVVCYDERMYSHIGVHNFWFCGKFEYIFMYTTSDCVCVCVFGLPGLSYGNYQYAPVEIYIERERSAA